MNEREERERRQEDGEKTRRWRERKGVSEKRVIVEEIRSPKEEDTVSEVNK